MGKKTNVILVVAKSGAGKDYVVNKILDSNSDMVKDNSRISKVISRTTRKPRYEGEDTHLFIDAVTAHREIFKSIAWTKFSGNYYYAMPEDLINHGIYIIDPNGVKEFKNNSEYNKFDTIVFSITCPWYLRLIRMIKRDGLFKAVKRIITDIKDFKDIDKYVDISAKTGKEAQKVFSKLVKEFLFLEKPSNEIYF